MSRFTAILSAFLLFFCFFSGTLPEEKADGYEYTIIGERAIITGYTGTPSYIGIPDTLEGYPVTEIRDNAFYQCTSLRSISLPDSVTVLGHHCFYACSSLESIVLPPGTKEIGMGCFCGCTSLSAVSLPQALSVLPDSCFRACTSLSDIVMPPDIVTIEKFCFSGCTGLKYVSLNSGLESIGEYAFYMCPSLESIYIPETVREIDCCAAGFTPGNDGECNRCDGFTVLGGLDSAAMDYAETNGFAFTEASEAVQAFSELPPDKQQDSIPPALIASGMMMFLILFIVVLKLTKNSEH